MKKREALYLHSASVLAPGLPSWDDAQEILSGKKSWQYADMERYKPQLLPPNERRRATDVARLVFKTSEEALNTFLNKNASDKDLVKKMASVFASSGGDYQVIDQICRSLSLPEREVSPTRFHNSVHNAPAGYWGIATGSRAPSSSLSAFDFSFIIGLLEASMLLEDNPLVIFSCYDMKPVSPLLACRPITEPFSVSFILGKTPFENDLASLFIRECDDEIQQLESEVENKSLESLHRVNPAARSLPLLESIAKQEPEILFYSMPGSGVIRLETSFE